MAFAETAELAARLTLRDDFSGTLNRANSSLGRFQGNLGKIGSGVGKVGAGLTAIGTKAAVAAGAGLLAAAKASIDFQDAFAGVEKTVEASPAELAALNQQLRALSTRIPVNFQDLAGIAQEAGALGVATKDVASFTETVSRLSAATVGLSTAGAAEAFGKLGNVLFTTKQKADGLSQEYSQLGSALIALGNAGASSEGDIIEIAKRFGAAGHQAGLSAAQVLGFSSAIASLGVEPEAAGSSLSRLFNRITTYIGTGSAKIKAFTKVTGLSLAEFKKRFSEDASGTVQLFLQQLGKLNNYQIADVLKKAGLTNIRDITAIQLLSQNTGELARQVNLSTDAYAKNTDLLTVSNKRFDTLKNKLIELKNEFFVAAATVGDGFTPAIGRAADKLAAFLRIPANQQALTKLGQDIGKFIDSINWGEVAANAKTFVAVLQTATDWAVKLLNALNKLPTEVKAAGIAFLGLNKLSGGLLGKGLGDIASGVIGGLGKGLISKIPGVGKLTATPVYVVNFPPGVGGLGGAAGAAGGGLSTLGKIALVGETVGLVAAVEGVRESIANGNTQIAQNLNAQTDRYIASQPSREQLLGSLAAVDKGISDILHNPLTTLVEGDALNQLVDMRQKLLAQLKELNGLRGAVGNVTPEISRLSGTVNGIGTKLTGAIGNLTPHFSRLEGQEQSLIGKVGNITPQLSRLGGKVDGTTNAIRRKRLSTVVNVHTNTNVSVSVSARQTQNAFHQAQSWGATVANKA